MDVKSFIDSIYLGDRCCIETKYNEGRTFTIKMNGISRTRSSDGKWNFYTDEDIVEGLIVFDGVTKLEYDTKDFELNDEIYNIDAEQEENGSYLFSINGSCADNQGYKEGTVRILASDVYLIDPNMPFVKIRD